MHSFGLKSQKKLHLEHILTGTTPTVFRSQTCTGNSKKWRITSPRPHQKHDAFSQRGSSHVHVEGFHFSWGWLHGPCKCEERELFELKCMALSVYTACKWHLSMTQWQKRNYWNESWTKPVKRYSKVWQGNRSTFRWVGNGMINYARRVDILNFRCAPNSFFFLWCPLFTAKPAPGYVDPSSWHVHKKHPQLLVCFGT